MNIPTLIVLALIVSLFVTVLGYGMQATWDDLTYVLRRPGQFARALLAMYVIMPVFVGLMISVFRFDPIINIALLALSVSPVPPLLPSRAFRAGGSRSYTLGLVVAAAVLSIVIVPVAIEIFERVFDHPARIPAAKVVLTVFVGIFLPLTTGVIVRHFAPAFAERFAKTFTNIGMVLLILAILPILITAMPIIWSLIGDGTVLAFAAFAIIGLTVGHLLGGPEPNDRMVLAISCASRHPGIALAIVATNVVEPKMAMAAIFLYLIVAVLVAVPYLRFPTRTRDETARVENP